MVREYRKDRTATNADLEKFLSYGIAFAGCITALHIAGSDYKTSPQNAFGLYPHSVAATH